MSDASIDIVLKVSADASAEGVVKKTLSDIKRVAESEGRAIGQTTSKGIVEGFGLVEQQATRTFKKIGDSASRENLTQRMVEGSTTAFQKMSREYEQAVRMMRRETDVFAKAGIVDPIDRRAKLAALSTAQKALNNDYLSGVISAKELSRAYGELEAKQKLVETGNSRGRGAMHKMIASLASFAFEATGAVFAITSLAAVIGGPALFGGKFLKDIEDSKVGIAGIIASLGSIDGASISAEKALAIADIQIKQLTQSAHKYGLSVDEVVSAYRAMLGNGMSVGMNMEEIGKIATVGALAVKAFGLNAQQTNQELRDLVTPGGVTSASSTIATALGITNAKLKELANESKLAKGDFSEFFKFLEGKFAGVASVATLARMNTFTGILDGIKIKLQSAFADEALFNQFKDFMRSISDQIGSIDSEGVVRISKSFEDSAKGYLFFMNQALSVVTALVTTIGNALNIINQLNALTDGWMSRIIIAIGSIKLGLAILPTAIKTMLAGMLPDFALAGAASGALYGKSFDKSSNLTMYVGSALGKAAPLAAAEGAVAGGAFGVAFSRVLPAAMYTGLAILIYSVAETIVDSIMGESGAFTKGITRGVLEARKIVSSMFGLDTSDIDAKIAEWKQKAQEATTLEQRIAKGTATPEDLRKVESNTKAIANLKERQELEKHYKLSENLLEEHNKKRLEIAALYGNAYTEALAIGDKEQADAILKTRDKVLKAEDEAYAKLDKSGKQHFKSLLDQYGAFEKQLQEQVANGTLSFVGEYNQRLKMLEAMTKSATDEKDKQYLNKEIAEAGKKYATALKATGKEVRDLWVDVFGETLSEGDKWFAGFENKFNTWRDIIALGLVEATNAGKPEQIAEMTAMYEQLAKTMELSPQVKAVKDLQSDIAKLNTLYETRIAQLELEAALAGGGAMVELNAQYAIQVIRLEQIAEQQEKINAFKLANPEMGAEAKKQFDEMNKALVVLQTTAARAGNELDRSFGKGATQAFEAYTRSATNAAENTRRIFEGAFGKMEDALVSFVKTGKLDFKDLMDFIKAELIKLAAKQIIVSIGASLGSTSAQAAVTGGGGIVNTVSGAYNMLTNSSASGGWANGFSNAGSEFAKSSLGEQLGFSTTTAPTDFVGPTQEGSRFLTEAGSSFSQGAATAATYAGYAMGAYNSIKALENGQYGRTAGGAIGTYLGAGNPIASYIGAEIGGVVDRIFGFGQQEDPHNNQDNWNARYGFNMKSGGIYGTAYGAPMLEAGGQTSGSGRWTDEFAIAADKSSELNTIMKNTIASVATKAIEAGFSTENLSNLDVNLDLTSTKSYEDVINQTVNKLGEAAISSLIPNIQKFTSGTETITETFSRITGNVIVVKNVFELLNKPFTSVGEASVVLSNNLIALFGGLDALNTSMSSYYNNFFTETERNSRSLDAITKVFEGLNITLPTSRQGFRDIVEGLDLTTTTGQSTFKTLMGVQEAFANLNPVINDVTSELVKTAQDNLRSAYEAEVSRVNDLKTALDNANAAYEQAKQDVAAFYQAEIDAKKTLISNLAGYIKSLKDFAHSLKIGSLSNLNPEQKYQSAKSLYESTLLSAKGGDLGAIDKIQSVAEEFLNQSQAYFASSEQYSTDLGGVQQALDSLQTSIGAQISSTEEAVNAEQAKIDALNLVTKTSKTLESALSSMGDASLVAKTALEAYTKANTDLTTYTSQVTTALGSLTPTIMSVAEALANLAAALNQKSTPTKSPSVSDVYTSAAGATYDKTKDVITSNTGNVLGSLDKVSNIAKDILDTQGAKALYDAAKDNGVSLVDVNTLLGRPAGTAEQWAKDNGLPTFATGGFHAGGVRLVGENGPELEATGASRIFNAQQTRAILSGAANDSEYKQTVNSIPVLQAGFTGVIEKLDKVEKRLISMEDQQRKDNL